MRPALISARLLLPVLLAQVALCAPPGSDDLLVSLKQGSIRGKYVTVRGAERKVREHLGIPFARPPVGSLRLSAPQDPEPWEGERDGTILPPMCMQNTDVMPLVGQIMSMDFIPLEASEDCLYLNIYSPAGAGAATAQKLPVLVWIHGGGLTVGAASWMDGAPLAAYENMVVVAVQYRLGFLGFLSTGDEHAQGNWGFLDQLAALRWVKENIADFGGDPNSVTVAGESAGGISASILTLSPQSKGLFHRAIFQSGVATIGTYTIKNPLGHAKIVAGAIGCDLGSTQEMVQCVRGKSREELLEATKKVNIYMGAVVDGQFLTDTAEELLKKKEVLKIPVMMGITNHEFGWILPKTFARPGWENGMDREAVLAVMNQFNERAAVANGLLADEYLKGSTTPEQIRDGFTEVMSDLLMTLPTISVAGYHADAEVPVYLYEFAHRADLYKELRPDFVKADHGDDLLYMFGGCFWNGHLKVLGNFSAEEENLCRTMMTYWANFARNGSPDGPGLVTWPKYSRQTQDYMELDLTQTVRQRLKEDRVHFATVTVPQKLQQMASPSVGAA